MFYIDVGINGSGNELRFWLRRKPSRKSRIPWLDKLKELRADAIHNVACGGRQRYNIEKNTAFQTTVLVQKNILDIKK